MASMSPASGWTGSPFTKVTDVTIKDRVDPKSLELVQMAGLSRQPALQPYVEVAVLGGAPARAQPLLDGGSVVTVVTSEFARLYGLRTYNCPPEKFLAINGGSLHTDMACNFQVQFGDKQNGVVWRLEGVRVLVSPDVRFVIGVDVMFGEPGIVAPMVIDYSG